MENQFKMINVEIRDDTSMIKKFIPLVPVVEYHLLPQSAENRLQLCTINKLMGDKQNHFKAKLSFKLHYSTSLPFMVLFEVTSNHDEEILSCLSVNDTDIELSRDYSDVFNPHHRYYMGNVESSKYYSYLPNFKKLFYVKNKLIQHLSIKAMLKLHDANYSM